MHRENSAVLIDRANQHAHVLGARISKGNASYDWGQRHNDAWLRPQGPSAAIIALIRGLAYYADAHYARYQDTIGNDYVLGEGWSEIAQGIRTLLNGELGALDGGTLDEMLSAIMSANNIDPETGDHKPDDAPETEDARFVQQQAGHRAIRESRK